jgi:hypothetical protein
MTPMLAWPATRRPGWVVLPSWENLLVVLGAQSQGNALARLLLNGSSRPIPGLCGGR